VSILDTGVAAVLGLRQDLGDHGLIVLHNLSAKACTAEVDVGEGVEYLTDLLDERTRIRRALNIAQSAAVWPEMTQAIAAMCRQLSAQRRQTSAHCCIIGSSLSAAHSSTQRAQISAQTAQVRPWNVELRIMKSALVAQICAQSCSVRMWPGSACLPPCWRQCWMVARQIA
jgi:hypothetical protein